MQLRTLATGRDLTVGTVRCTDDHRRWSPAEQPDRPGLVLVRCGRFRRRSHGRVIEADPTRGYLRLPGVPERFAHPAGGDVCTWVGLTPVSWRQVCDDLARAGSRDLDGAGDGDPRGTRGHPPSAATTGVPAAWTLQALADLLDVSPFRLSRAFSRHVGMPFTRFRNRVRIGLALERIESGASDLAALAADLGFADQAHLCRTMRQFVGAPPSQVRAGLHPEAVARPPTDGRAAP